MSEDEKMFQIGIWTLGMVALLTIGLQVCYRTQNKSINRVRTQIVQTQQNIAVEMANFASYGRPEILRNIVTGIYPHAERVSFNKSVAINELPVKE